MNKIILILILILILIFSGNVFSEGNVRNFSFNKAKKLLDKQVYNKLPRKTIYCAATFDEKRQVVDHNGFYSYKYKKRAKKIEWEHVVPAENFGRAFVEWREGHPDCVTKKGKAFKGRNCASKINNEYRYMQADMYNLYPAIGAVNGLRSNYRYSGVVVDGDALGGCEMLISSKERRVVPPDYAKGIVARVSLYFDETYRRYNLSDSQRKLFKAWDIKFPVTDDECKRNSLIENLQGNVNQVLKNKCK
jgi:deoxyribonuclease-1